MKTSDILQKPKLTEKAYSAIAQNKYIFQVAKNASKDMIKDAIENLFQVSVLSVKTITIRPKKKTRGKKTNIVKIGGGKKAIVEVKEGQTISLFDEIFSSNTNDK